jgi:phosphoribosylamine--glycine ligase
MAQQKRAMVIGSGGREHALAERLLDSPSTAEVLVVPGNAGTAAELQTNGRALRNVLGDPLSVARGERPDLIVVGPEVPLCEGLVDALSAEGLCTYGPSGAAARLEGSKVFMKEFASRHGIPTARYHVVRSEAELERAVRDFELPPVIKADGLCAGKGVVVAATAEEALMAGRHMLSGEAFGDAGRVVLVEERLSGGEASVHAIADGERFLMLPAAQDHKRIGDGDRGPNTGGMGCYAPNAEVGPEVLEQARDMVERVVAGMRADGSLFRGTIFAGLMIPESGKAKLLEINVRFGDPETEVLMPLIEGDFTEALIAAARGELDPQSLSASSDAALCVVLASEGYPVSARNGDVIEGLDRAAQMPNVRVYHAGTRLEAGRVLTNGGRVVAISARGQDLKTARDRAYEAVAAVRFDGMQFRRDIGHRALDAQ